MLQDIFVTWALKLIENSTDARSTLIELHNLGREFMDAMSQDIPDARYVTDKMLGIIYFVAIIKLMLLNAKIIHSVRDPIDACFSSYPLQFAVGNEFTFDLEILGRHYKNYQELMRYGLKSF